MRRTPLLWSNLHIHVISNPSIESTRRSECTVNDCRTSCRIIFVRAFVQTSSCNLTRRIFGAERSMSCALYSETGAMIRLSIEIAPIKVIPACMHACGKVIIIIIIMTRIRYSTALPRFIRHGLLDRPIQALLQRAPNPKPMFQIIGIVVQHLVS